MKGLDHCHPCLVSLPLATIALLSLLVLVTGSAGAQTDPPTIGDWVVSDTTSLDNVTVILNGNLTVTSGGDLTLRSVRLQVNCTHPGQYGVLVEAGGSLTAVDTDGSMFTPADATTVHNLVTENHYTWRCAPGSRLRLNNSAVLDCGIDSPGKEGLVIETDDARVENTTFVSGHCGIRVLRSSPYLFLAVTSEMEGHGIHVSGGSPQLVHCMVAQSVRSGIVVMGSNGTDLVLCHVSGVGGSGIVVGTSTLTMTGCEVENVTVHGVRFVGDCSALVSETIINKTGKDGVNIGKGCTIGIDNCEVTGCRERGIWAKDSTLDVNGTRVHNCTGDATSVQATDLEVEGCTLESCTGSGLVVRGDKDAELIDSAFLSNGVDGVAVSGIPPGGPTAVLLNCTIVGNGRAGVSVDENATCKLFDGQLRDNTAYGVYCTDQGELVLDVHGDMVIVNETLRVRGHIGIDGGAGSASLTLVNTSLLFVETEPLVRGHIDLRNGTLKLMDGDNSSVTQMERSEISVTDDNDEPEPTILVRGGSGSGLVLRNSYLFGVWVDMANGYVNASGCKFENLPRHMESRNMSVSRCTFSDSRRGIWGRGDGVVIDQCSFYRVESPIHLEWADGSGISDCGITSSRTGIFLYKSDDVVISNTSVAYGADGIVIHGCRGVTVVDTTVSTNDAHGMKVDNSTVSVIDSRILISGTGGLVADDCWLVLHNVSLHANTRAGIMANESDLVMDNSSVTDTSGIGIWLRHSEEGYGPAGPLMRDCLLHGGEAYDLRLEGFYRGVAYNSDVDTESVRVLDSAVFEMHHLFRTEVVVEGKEPIPPPPVEYVVTDSTGGRAAEGTMEDERFLPVMWLIAYRLTSGGSTFLSPYNVTVTMAGRDRTGEVELGYNMVGTVRVPYDLVAVVDIPEGIYEGEEVALDASASVGFPFGLAEWEWVLDVGGEPSIEIGGPVVTWEFPHDGRYVVTLNLTDKVGNTNGTELVITVLDEWPHAQITSRPLNDVQEDQEATFEGSHGLVVDEVLVLEWDLGDGGKAEGPQVTHSWEKAGVYNVTFTVVEVDGVTDAVTIQVTVVNVEPKAHVTNQQYDVSKHEEIFLDASPSYDTPSDNSSLTFLWTIGGEPVLSGVQGALDLDGSGTYTIRLAVVDDDGAQDSVLVTVTVTNRPPTIGTIADVTLKSSGVDHRIYLRDLVEDPDDPESDWTVIPSVPTEGVVDVDAILDQGRGWYVTIYPLPGKTGRVEVTVRVDDGDGGETSTTFTVTVEEEGAQVPTWVLVFLASVVLVVALAAAYHGGRLLRRRDSAR